MSRDTRGVRDRFAPDHRVGGAWLAVVFAFGTGLWPARVAAEPVSVVLAGPRAIEVAKYLRSRLGASAPAFSVLRTMPDLAVFVRDAAIRFPESRTLLVVDSDRAVIHVVRNPEGVILTRVLRSDALRVGPFPIALAAAQLLEVADLIPSPPSVDVGLTAPPTDREPTGDKKPSPAAAGDTVIEHLLPEDSSASPGRWLLPSLVLSVGAAASVETTDGVATLQPAFGADIMLRLPRSRWWSSLGLRVAPLAGAYRAVPSYATGASARYQRTDLATRISGGLVRGRWSMALTLDVGVAVSDVTVTRAEGDVLGREERSRFYFGPSFDFRCYLIAGFSLGVLLGAVILPRPTRYLVDENPVFSEGPVRLRSGFNLYWEFP